MGAGGIPMGRHPWALGGVLGKGLECSIFSGGSGGAGARLGGGFLEKRARVVRGGSFLIPSVGILPPPRPLRPS